LRERILSAAAAIERDEARHSVRRTPRPVVFEVKRFLAPLAAAASLAVAATLVWQHLRRPAETPFDIPAFTLVNRAYAAEAAIFNAGPVVHMVNEIAVKPADDGRSETGAWLPLVSLQASGKPRINQLTLPARAGEGYMLVDECWYEQATGRFRRQITKEGRPIFGNSFDGQATYSLDAAGEGGAQVQRMPVTAGFEPPKSPALILGMSAGLPSYIDEKNKDLVTDAGKTVLPDGAAARQVRLGYRGPDGKPLPGYVLVTIRTDDNTIAHIEMVLENKPVYDARRAKTETLAAANVAWDLTDLAGAKKPAGTSPQIAMDMVKPDVTPAAMAEHADFATYLFKTAPAWAPKRFIVDALDIASPPKRMFIVVYQATDGRHVVLVQAPTYNQIGTSKQSLGKVVYTSPRGVKVYSSDKDKWLAGILLQSARMYMQAGPAEDRTGYLLETPEGTYPALAVNGKLSDEEMHQLVDSLTPAKEVQ
jgi:hypothetical protein